MPWWLGTSLTTNIKGKCVSYSKRIAVVGAGIAGLVAAYRLHQQGWAVTLFESQPTFGGHAHTVDITLEGMTHGVDTGFLVYNERTYPGLIALFAELGVRTAPTDMSFSVKATRPGTRPALEWSGRNLATVFSQKRNLVSPRFWAMLVDIVRFNRLATGLAVSNDPLLHAQTVGDFLTLHRFGLGFTEDYFLPMIACIWSCPTEQMRAFPMATLVRFCHNHGLLQVSGRPQWYTVTGGSRHYVEKIVAALPDARAATPVLALMREADQVRVVTQQGTESFDQVVLACHPDQTLALLGQGATHQERRWLGAIRYQPNTAVLHTDASVLPQRRAAWAAWNYERANRGGATDYAQVCLHYLINRLQPLPFQTPVVVSLNPVTPIQPDKVLQSFQYDHPIFDAPAMAAQQQVAHLQGRRRSWFCGAWCGYGFHEDGLQAGTSVAAALTAQVRGEQSP